MQEALHLFEAGRNIKYVKENTSASHAPLVPRIVDFTAMGAERLECEFGYVTRGPAFPQDKRRVGLIFEML